TDHPGTEWGRPLQSTWRCQPLITVWQASSDLTIGTPASLFMRGMIMNRSLNAVRAAVEIKSSCYLQCWGQVASRGHSTGLTLSCPCFCPLGPVPRHVDWELPRETIDADQVDRATLSSSGVHALGVNALLAKKEEGAGVSWREVGGVGAKAFSIVFGFLFFQCGYMSFWCQVLWLLFEF
ncbi:hypothetical protein BaRGS_00001455, partial [Batillaria attramentaria]